MEKARHHAIDQRHDRVPRGNRQRTVRAEVILDIHDQENVGLAWFDRFANLFLVSGFPA
jgi:hypothetical protein